MVTDRQARTSRDLSPNLQAEAASRPYSPADFSHFQHFNTQLDKIGEDSLNGRILFLLSHGNVIKMLDIKKIQGM